MTVVGQRSEGAAGPRRACAATACGHGVRPAAFGLGRRRAADGGQRAVSASGRGTRRAAATGGPSSRRRQLSGGHRWRRSRRTQLTRGASSLRGWPPCARPRTTSCRTPPRPGGAHCRREDRPTGRPHAPAWAFVTGPGADRSRRASPSRGGRRQRAFPSTDELPRRRHAGCI